MGRKKSKWDFSPLNRKGIRIRLKRNVDGVEMDDSKAHQASTLANDIFTRAMISLLMPYEWWWAWWWPVSNTMNETQISKVDAINFLVLNEDLKFWIELNYTQLRLRKCHSIDLLFTLIPLFHPFIHPLSFSIEHWIINDYQLGE